MHADAMMNRVKSYTDLNALITTKLLFADFRATTKAAANFFPEVKKRERFEKQLQEKRAALCNICV